jgi:hypothetical protein
VILDACVRLGISVSAAVYSPCCSSTLIAPMCYTYTTHTCAVPPTAFLP